MTFVRLTELLIEIIDLLLRQFIISEIDFSSVLCTSFWEVLFLRGIPTMETTEQRAMFSGHCLLICSCALFQLLVVENDCWRTV